jgi:hypothetical protein
MNQEEQEIWTKQNLIEIAKYQKILIWMILIILGFVSIFGSIIFTDMGSSGNIYYAIITLLVFF